MSELSQEGAEWPDPFESCSLGLTAHSTSFCRRTPKEIHKHIFMDCFSGHQTHLTMGREGTVCLSSKGKGTAALRAPAPPFQATWSLFSPPKLVSSGGTMKPWIKFPRNLLRLRAITPITSSRETLSGCCSEYFSA